MGWDGTGMNCYGMGWDGTEKIVPWTSLGILSSDKAKRMKRTHSSANATSLGLRATNHTNTHHALTLLNPETWRKRPE